MSVATGVTNVLHLNKTVSSMQNFHILEMIKRDVPGFAIGGLSGGEEKDHFWRIVTLCTDILPKDKPRYLMGVG